MKEFLLFLAVLLFTLALTSPVVYSYTPTAQLTYTV